MIPIGLFADLIDGLGDPGIAREGGKPSGFVIAVGAPIAERPPHRSVRADCPHTAPTSGV